jgi:hypothetical protein
VLGAAGVAGAGWLVAVQEAVVVWGPWVVLFFLLAEVGLYLLANIREQQPALERPEPASARSA